MSGALSLSAALPIKRKRPIAPIERSAPMKQRTTPNTPPPRPSHAPPPCARVLKMVSIYDITLNNLSMSLKTSGLGDFLFQLVISKKMEKR